MPCPHTPSQPSADQLRRMALGSTVYSGPRGGSGVPSYVGSAQVIENAAGWSPHWKGAAIYRVHEPYVKPTPRYVAVLVVAVQHPGEKRPWWGVARLCSWPA